MLKIYPRSQTWNQLTALDRSPWERFLLAELPSLFQDAYDLAEAMRMADQVDHPDQLKQLTLHLHQQVQKRIEQKMIKEGMS